MAFLNNILKHIHLFWQIVRFGIVGLTAALVHFSCVVYCVEKWGMYPLNANIFAFCLAIQVSYWGHRTWTFKARNITHKIAMPRILTVYISGLVANEILYSFFMYGLKLPYTVSLVLVIGLMAIVTFFANKLWVFKIV